MRTPQQRERPSPEPTTASAGGGKDAPAQHNTHQPRIRPMRGAAAQHGQEHHSRQMQVAWPAPLRVSRRLLSACKDPAWASTSPFKLLRSFSLHFPLVLPGVVVAREPQTGLPSLDHSFLLSANTRVQTLLLRQLFDPNINHIVTLLDILSHCSQRP